MRYIYFLMPYLALGLLSCNTNIDKDYILQNYSKEEIIFFWESAYFNDEEGKKGRFNDSTFFILRWDNDIHIKTFGELSRRDSLALYDAISQINEIGLPIKVLWVPDTAQQCNLEMYFGRKEDINQIFSTKFNTIEIDDSASAFGVVQNNNNNHIQMARIGVYNDSVYMRNASPISHELLNALGLQGDPFSDIEGVLYDTKPCRTQTQFSEIEKKALKLLYSPAIKAETSRLEFLEAFRAILPPRGISAQDYIDFENYIKKKQYSLETIEEFLSMSFLQSRDIPYYHISKWKTTPIISFESDSLETSRKPQIENIINRINKYSEGKYSVTFVPRGKPCNLEITTEGEGGISEAVGQSGVQITFAKLVICPPNRSDSVAKQHQYNQILEALTGISGGDQSPLQSGLTIPYSSEYLQLYLSPFVKSGMTRERIVNILKEHYKLSSRWQTPDYEFLEKHLANKGLSDSAIYYIKHQLNSVPFKHISKTEMLRIYLGDSIDKDFNLIKELKETIGAYISIELSSKNSCNLSVNYFDGDHISINSYYNLEGFQYSNIQIPRKFRNNISSIKVINAILTNIFPEINNQHVLKLENNNFITNQYWKEAFKFYQSSHIQSSMDRKKVVKIIEKYYPNE